MERKESWSRHNYPVQSPDAHPVDEVGGDWTESQPGEVQIPGSFRASRDSQKHNAKARTIVVCLDGTGDKFDNDNSNIVHLVSCLKKDDKSQATYYQAGIGTYSQFGAAGGVSAAMDMAVGSGLGLHVRDAYHFLMHTYKEGDKICIFGFSRGAYTARCLAGMVHKVGLLPPRNTEQILFAYDIYKDQSPQGWEQSLEFKKTFCIDVSVYFLGVFDSVSSVGIIPRQLPLSSTPWNKARYFRHAIALDERRAKFKPARFQKKDFDEIRDPKRSGYTIMADVSAASRVNSFADGPNTGTSTSLETHPQANGTIHRRHATSTSQPSTGQVLDAHRPLPPEMMNALGEEEYERRTGHIKPYETDVEEVWFLGCHADVGGGAVPNSERHKLANIPLRWMLRQCFECETGILFKAKALAECGVDVHSLWPRYIPQTVPKLGPPPSLLDRYNEGLPPIKRRADKLIPIKSEKDATKHRQRGDDDLYNFSAADAEEAAATTGEWMPEQVEDYFDAMSPWNDQLVVAKMWWILEAWPVAYRVQRTDNDQWETRTGMNMGMYRAMEDAEPKVHWTVQHRMNTMGYKMGARTGRQCLPKFVT